MGEILGIGTTHYPPGLVPEEYKPWPLARMLHTDPRIPPHLRNPASCPEPMRAEWGHDEGVSAFKAHRERVFSAFRTLRDEITAFRPTKPGEAVIAFEGVGDRNQAAHEANLYDMDAKYGDVVTLAETLAHIEELAAARV